MTAPTDPPIIVATPTVIDGLVLRWYRDAAGWERNADVMSASRNGVSIYTEYLHQVPAGWLEDAQHAHLLMEEGRISQARALATHEPTRLFGGELRPIQRPVESAQESAG